MSILGALNESMLTVTTANGVLDAVENAYEDLSAQGDRISGLLTNLIAQVERWEAAADRGERPPSAAAQENFVNDLKDQVEEWLYDNR